MTTRTKKREVNLDNLEAQRREATKTAPTIKFKGKTFELPVEMPWAVVEAYGVLQEIPEDERSGKSVTLMIDVARAMLGDEYEAFTALNPSSQNVMDLIEAVFTVYGTSAGESQASGTS